MERAKEKTYLSCLTNFCSTCLAGQAMCLVNRDYLFLLLNYYSFLSSVFFLGCCVCVWVAGVLGGFFESLLASKSQPNETELLLIKPWVTLLWFMNSGALFWGEVLDAVLHLFLFSLLQAFQCFWSTSVLTDCRTDNASFHLHCFLVLYLMMEELKKQLNLVERPSEAEYLT